MTQTKRKGRKDTAPVIHDSRHLHMHVRHAKDAKFLDLFSLRSLRLCDLCVMLR